MDRKNHKKVFTIEDTNILYISSREERDMNTTNTTTTHTNERNSNVVFLNVQ